MTSGLAIILRILRGYALHLLRNFSDLLLLTGGTQYQLTSIPPSKNLRYQRFRHDYHDYLLNRL